MRIDYQTILGRILSRSCDSFIKNFQVFIFKEDEEEEIELPFSEKELTEKFDGKLEKEMKGPTVEILAKLLKVRQID